MRTARRLLALTLVSGFLSIGGAPLAAHAATTWQVSASTGSDPASGCPTNITYATVSYLFDHFCPQDADTVNVAAGVYDGPQVLIDQSIRVTIVGAGAGSTTLSTSDPATFDVFDSGATVSISGFEITHDAGTSGTGIDNTGTMTVTNCIITGIIGSETGGGIINGSTATLTVVNSTVSNNTGSIGGGIENQFQLYLINSTVSGNTATLSSGAGGVFNAENNADANIMNSTISGNTGDAGGIMSDIGSTLELANSTVSGNTGGVADGFHTEDTGGVANHGILTSTNTTIGNNSPGGLLNTDESHLSNTIVAGNTGGTSGDCSGTQAVTDATGAHNLIGKAGTNCDATTLTGAGDQIGSSGTPVNPKLGPLANNGGPTQTMALLTGSPAIGRGDGVTCGASPVSDKDQRGDLRNSAGRSSCDIGAYDTGGVTTITVTPASGWILLGGYPLTVWNDTVAVWSYSATSGSWTALSGASPPQPSGTGAWEDVTAAGGGSPHTVSVLQCTSGVPLTLTVFAYRWNMVANPCNRAVNLPAGVHALLYQGGRYVLSGSIPAALAAWVVPSTGSLTIMPV